MSAPLGEHTFIGLLGLNNKLRKSKTVPRKSKALRVGNKPNKLLW